MLIRQFFHDRFCELHQYVRQGFFTKFLRVDKSRSSTLINTKYDTILKIPKARTEIGKCVLINFQNLWLYLSLSQVRFLRKTSGSKLNVFAPVDDLSSLSKSSFETRSLVAGKQNDVAITGGHILGDEYTNHVIKVSSANFTPLLLLNLVVDRTVAVSFSAKGGLLISFLHVDDKTWLPLALSSNPINGSVVKRLKIPSVVLSIFEKYLTQTFMRSANLQLRL